MLQPPTRKYLTGEEQIELVRRIAFFENFKEIRSWLKEGGKNLDRRTYWHYLHSEKWKPIISKFREQFNKEMLDIPFANKRKRVLEYAELYKEAKKKKQFSIASNQLTEIRHELEGDGKSGDTYYQFAQFNKMSDEDVDERMKQLIKQINDRRKSYASGIGEAETVDGNGSS